MLSNAGVTATTNHNLGHLSSVANPKILVVSLVPPWLLPNVGRCLFSICLLFCSAGCVKFPTQEPPVLSTTIFPSSIARLPDPPPRLGFQDAHTAWGQEYTIGKVFAEEGDLYRAATCFHRARIILNTTPGAASARKVHMVHALLLCYSLGGKYQEAIDLWERERETLSIEDPDLARDCIILLHEAYTHLHRPQDAAQLLTVLPAQDSLRQRLPLFSHLASQTENPTLPPDLSQEVAALATACQQQYKNPTTARVLNAVLPGAGYWYVQQYQTAATSFVLNALFIAASWELFSAHLPAAAIIATGFEGGWYFGGITGAGMAATTYNLKVRERLTKPFLEQHHLFPLQQITYRW